MIIPAEFDEIRPYGPEELPAVFEEILADDAFRAAIGKVMPDMPFETFARELRTCRTSDEVQRKFCYPLLHQLAATCADGMEMDCSSLPRRDRAYTFVTNHRDIVLDSAFLSILMLDAGFPATPEIAIGDNLLILPWIKMFVRINKSFIVQRTLTMRQMLLSSARLGRYIHFAVNGKGQSVWIAQREGRAKDSDDRTQDAILKMMCMGGEGSVTERLKALHIVPTALSYEYDPCDYLKAKEFQLKRDVPGFKKSPQDDLDNMYTGIFGRKGRIHFHTGTCIDEWLDTLPADMPKTELYAAVAKHIDSEVHRNYRLYPGNYVAADLLRGNRELADHYTAGDKAQFEEYLQSRLDLIDLPHPDMPFLRERILTMYANPAINQLKANSQQ
ncbi:MAG: hypothetical protein NC388_06605 [Clostridium sp.]|nr:hypothetical protein [Clostridium sp.]